MNQSLTQDSEYFDFNNNFALILQVPRTGSYAVLRRLSQSMAILRVASQQMEAEKISFINS